MLQHMSEVTLTLLLTMLAVGAVIRFMPAAGHGRRGKKALCNARFDESGHVIKEGEQVVLGANDKYIGLCRKHWKEGNLGPQ